MVLNCTVDQFQSPFTEPAMARLVEIASREFTAKSGDGIARATLLGDMSVLRVEVDAKLEPALAATRVTEALNQALATASETVRAELAGAPHVSAQLVEWLQGAQPAPELDELAPLDDVLREFSGSFGEVTVTFDGRTREFVSIHLPEVSQEVLALVPAAANRALASAQLGRDGAVPLSEQIDERLGKLDEALSTIESSLDDAARNLESVWSNLRR